ncbi:MAG: tetratricopeptide repeat protein [Nitrospinae bacterium]|nr:tetratricopeptide repeat protein [Nitrospinota bacterium]MBI3814175.1 tetratricopeptide repeat protein [Nitrospinota bacterium]
MSNEQRATSLKKIFISLIAHCSLLIFLSCDDAPKKLFNDAERDLLDGRYQQAADKYNQILAKYPRSGYADEALYKLGETYFLNLNNIQIALEYFSELISKGRRGKASYKSQQYIAQIYDEHLKNYDRAIVEYHKLTSDFKKWGNTDVNQYNIAMCYFKKGDYEQAATEFKVFLEKHPESELSPDALYQFSNCKYLIRKYNEAIVGYKKLIETYQGSRYVVDAKYGIGICLEEQEKLKEALSIYNEIKDLHANRAMLGKKIEGLEKRLRERGR